MTARAPFIKTYTVAVTATPTKLVPINYDRSYMAIFNPAATVLSVALGGDTAPGADDYFTLAQHQYFEFHCPPSSAVWFKAAGAQRATVAEAN